MSPSHHGPAPGSIGVRASARIIRSSDASPAALRSRWPWEALSSDIASEEWEMNVARLPGDRELRLFEDDKRYIRSACIWAAVIVGGAILLTAVAIFTELSNAYALR